VTFTGQPILAHPQFAFILKQIHVTLAGAGSGQVTAPGDSYGDPAIVCGSDCDTTLLHSGSVTLTASAAPGSHFTGWSGCPYVTGSDGRQCQIGYSENTSSPAAVNVTATFAPN
jgi:hypothetical protein